MSISSEVNYPEEVIKELSSHIESILRILGEDTTREGLVKTPVRAAKALYYITDGYRHKDKDIVGDALFTSGGSRMVVVKDIEFYSMCEHHILPFFGHISIGYIPDGKIIGLSKIARLVNLYARRLQVQERLTKEIVHAVAKATGSESVIAVATGEHLCMKMRGVENHDSSTVTTEFSGKFETDPLLRMEFLNSLK